MAAGGTRPLTATAIAASKTGSFTDFARSRKPRTGSSERHNEAEEDEGLHGYRVGVCPYAAVGVCVGREHKTDKSRTACDDASIGAIRWQEGEEARHRRRTNCDADEE